MRLLAAGNITFTDLSDASSAMLTSDVLLVPCDSMGVPRLALGSSPLTSRMIILQGGIEQTGWSFSRTQQGVTASVDSLGMVSVTAISADNGYVEITASKPGQASLIKKLTVSKVYQGETGSLASDFSIELSPAAFQISSRGMVMEAQVITATCRKVNIAGSPAITWTADAVQLSSTTGGTVAITIEASVMLASFTIGCTVAGYGTKTLEVQGIRSGSPRPLYLGLLALPPADTPEGPLLYNPGLGGDYYLGTDMIPYYFNGTEFTSEAIADQPNYASIMGSVVSDVLKVGDPVPVSSAVYGYFQHLAAVNAFIENLTVEKAQSHNYQEDGDGVPTHGFKLDGPSDLIKAVDAILRNALLSNAFIKGNTLIQCGDDADVLLKTQYGSESGLSYTAAPKNRWRGSDACSSVQPGSTGVPAWGGSSATYTQYKRVNAANPVVILSDTGSYEIRAAGIYHLRAKLYTYIGTGSDYCCLKINGTIMFDQRGGGSSGTLHVIPFSLNQGDVVDVTFQKITGSTSMHFGFEQDSLCLFNQSFSRFLIIANSDAAYATPLALGTAYSSAPTVTTADAWASALSEGQVLGCTQASLITVNGSPHTAKYIMREGNKLTVVTAANRVFSFFFPAGTQEPANHWYDIGGTLFISGETKGLAVGNLLPSANGRSIGEPGNRFEDGYFNTLDASALTLGNSSKNANGYTLLPNGLLLLWGIHPGGLTSWDLPISISSLLSFNSSIYRPGAASANGVAHTQFVGTTVVGGKITKLQTLTWYSTPASHGLAGESSFYIVIGTP